MDLDAIDAMKIFHKESDAINSYENAEESVLRLLASITLNLWYLRRNIIEAEKEKPSEYLIQCRNQVESIFNALARKGSKIDDRFDNIEENNDIYVIRRNDMCNYEQSIEILKPIIYYNAMLIQKGNAIIG